MKPSVKVVVLRGSQCLGKTTYTEFLLRQDTVSVLRDQIRIRYCQYLGMNFFEANPKDYSKVFHDNTEVLVSKIFESELIEAIWSKRHDPYPVVVVDCMHLKIGHIERIKQLLGIFKNTLDIETIIHYMPLIDFEEVLERNRSRTGFAVVNEKVLRSCYEKYTQIYSTRLDFGKHI